MPKTTSQRSQETQKRVEKLEKEKGKTSDRTRQTRWAGKVKGWQEQWRHLGRKRQRSESKLANGGSSVCRGCEKEKARHTGDGDGKRKRRRKEVVVLVSTGWKRGGFFYPWAEDRRWGTCSGLDCDWPTSNPVDPLSFLSTKHPEDIERGVSKSLHLFRCITIGSWIYTLHLWIKFKKKKVILVCKEHPFYNNYNK